MSTDREKHNTEKFNKVVLVVLMVLVAWASIVSQITSNNVTKIQERDQREQQCTTRVLFDIVQALNERTTYSTEQAQLNLELQQAQATFVRVLVGPPPATEVQQGDALRKYFDALRNFNEVVSKSTGKANAYPYPTQEQYMTCLERAGRG